MFHYPCLSGGVRLGSQHVALPRRAMPRCRTARIESISIFAAGRDAARHDGAMRHIVNLAIELFSHLIVNVYASRLANALAKLLRSMTPKCMFEDCGIPIFTCTIQIRDNNYDVTSNMFQCRDILRTRQPLTMQRNFILKRMKHACNSCIPSIMLY